MFHFLQRVTSSQRLEESSVLDAHSTDVSTIFHNKVKKKNESTKRMSPTYGFLYAD